jgi:hypothetical protein
MTAIQSFTCSICGAPPHVPCDVAKHNAPDTMRPYLVYAAAKVNGIVMGSIRTEVECKRDEVETFRAQFLAEARKLWPFDGAEYEVKISLDPSEFQ